MVVYYFHYVIYFNFNSLFRIKTIHNNYIIFQYSEVIETTADSAWLLSTAGLSDCCSSQDRELLLQLLPNQLLSMLTYALSQSKAAKSLVEGNIDKDLFHAIPGAWLLKPLMKGLSTTLRPNIIVALFFAIS